jgi:hypothetical protein
MHSANFTSRWNSWARVSAVGGRAEWLGRLATPGPGRTDEQAQIAQIASASPAAAAARPVRPRGDVTVVLPVRLLSRLFAATPVVRNRA